MDKDTPSYRGYRFPAEIISHAVWLYYRFSLSLRDVEDLLAKRGVIVSHETVRQWTRKCGPQYARALIRQRGRLGDTWPLDELFVKIRGQRGTISGAPSTRMETQSTSWCSRAATGMRPSASCCYGRYHLKGRAAGHAAS